MYWFTADEHYNHKKIIEYSNRPFESIEQMDEKLIANFNEVVGKGDVTIHAGDFCWLNKKEEVYDKYVKKLNGTHILLIGSHDHWQSDSAQFIWRKRINGTIIMVCHYCMRTWESSHYGAYQLFGHSHGRLQTPDTYQHDIGVDNNNYYPVSYEQIVEIMNKKPNNLDVLKTNR